MIGQEKGHFLALDLGGTNLRVVLVTLEGEGKYTTKYSKSRVTEDLKTGPMRALCGKSKKKLHGVFVYLTDPRGLLSDYIAECVDDFLTQEGLTNSEYTLYLGYTFSFPVLQSKVSRGGGGHHHHHSPCMLTYENRSTVEF